ncbi:hypothetical protein GGR33_001362 [Methylobacterium brachythecii]|uniref:Flagellar biosynthesis protein FliO n=1 Tax=Methylobacterium brachythecii TaxID=1176177 RepID=A0A7W6AJ79_9HYPH|nr:hypothetical protein [Methylobacterium brachythecii]MBB3901876.1 hypothetical protein [Methylobacterium brachythecii]GLS43256.1 flagellar biosynthesis protein FliO [Methylobacterium brachythecii]
MQFLVIFLVILVLLMGAVLLFRRIAGRGLSMTARTTNRARQPRLGIVDIYELDRQRQLILLRRDNVEHLLLVGGPNDVVVERNVIRSAGSRLPADTVLRPEPASDMAPVQDRQEPSASFGVSPFEMPLAVPPPKPGTNGHELASPGRAPPLDPALFEPEASPTDRQSTETATSRISIGQVGRILRRATPSILDPRAKFAPKQAQAEPTVQAAGSDAPPFVPPSLMSSGSPRPLDPAALSDMARQLETALRRQSSAVTPPPGPSPSPATPEEPAPTPTPPPPPAPPAAEPVIAQATARPNPSFMLGRANPVPQPPPPAPEPKPASLEMAMASPQQALAEEHPPASSAEAKAGQPQGGTPFTVEEIETEFARLLGRPLDRKN